MDPLKTVTVSDLQGFGEIKRLHGFNHLVFRKAWWFPGWWQLKYFLFSLLFNWGRWTQFDFCIFFKWVGSTTNQFLFGEISWWVFRLFTECFWPIRQASIRGCLVGRSWTFCRGWWGRLNQAAHGLGRVGHWGWVTSWVFRSWRLHLCWVQVRMIFVGQDSRLDAISCNEIKVTIFFNWSKCRVIMEHPNHQCQHLSSWWILRFHENFQIAGFYPSAFYAPTLRGGFATLGGSLALHWRSFWESSHFGTDGTSVAHPGTILWCHQDLW